MQRVVCASHYIKCSCMHQPWTKLRVSGSQDIRNRSLRPGGFFDSWDFRTCAAAGLYIAQDTSSRPVCCKQLEAQAPAGLLFFMPLRMHANPPCTFVLAYVVAHAQACTRHAYSRAWHNLCTNLNSIQSIHVNLIYYA